MSKQVSVFNNNHFSNKSNLMKLSWTLNLASRMKTLKFNLVVSLQPSRRRKTNTSSAWASWIAGQCASAFHSRFTERPVWTSWTSFVHSRTTKICQSRKGPATDHSTTHWGTDWPTVCSLSKGDPYPQILRFHYESTLAAINPLIKI